MAIEHNMKILLLSTSFNDSLIKDSFWEKEKKKSISFIYKKNNEGIEKNGVEGLDRILRSNRLSPNIITDYTNVVLTNRLEILLGLVGTREQYESIKQRYPQIIALAREYYDLVIVDIDHKLGFDITENILKNSDVIVSMISQRASQIEKIVQTIKEGSIIKEDNTIITIGKYMENTKYNVKNITRSILGKKETINVIPYNSLFFEATQEGKIIDLFINFMRLKEKDENYQFIQEVKRLSENIRLKIKSRQMTRN